LVGVEHRESFEEGDRVGFASIALRPLSLFVRHKAVGIDNGCAVLAPANTAAEAKRLAEGEPILGNEAVLDYRTPEDQYIDPRVLSQSRRVPRHGKRRFRLHGPPRLNPGDATGLELCDDLVGDFLIQARSVLAGTSASG
jgi:hypothetical protein